MKKVNKPVRGSSTGRPIMVLLDVLGERWSLRILWELQNERLTFRKLQERCDNVSPTSLNRRIKQLRHLKLIDNNEDGFGYTQWGSELSEHLIELGKWSEQWGKSL
ncbi:MAG: helix-turn-helix transcriptional regulator [Spongiibacteraceae bacterium]|nr:helix-turn-helix transcriptional regulator [Spongiibacteraceae bacterium]